MNSKHDSMDTDIAQKLRSRLPDNKKAIEPKASYEGDALVIGCQSCRYNPDPGSDECLTCMVDSMSRMSGCERIILRTGKDIEISGKSGSTIRRIASIKRWSVPMTSNGFKCRKCGRSRAAVMDKVWKGFPEFHFDSVYETIDAKPTEPECSKCLRSTRKAVEQMEADLESVRKSMTEGTM